MSTSPGPARVAAMTGALETLFFGGNRMLRVFGRVGDSDKEFELIMPDFRLREAMLVYSRNVALLSLLISLITATLVFYGDRPHHDPPDPGHDQFDAGLLAGAGRSGAHHRPTTAPTRSASPSANWPACRSNCRRRSANRSILPTSALPSPRSTTTCATSWPRRSCCPTVCAGVRDPTVQAFAPKLVRALDRAVSYSEGVLAYGRTQEAPPSRRRLRLRQLVDDVRGLLGIEGSGIEFVNAVDAGFRGRCRFRAAVPRADQSGRNAVQAMAADSAASVVRRLTIDAERQGSVSRILVTDTGPGLPQKARENLFAAFRGSARSGGTGLGLAIAHELVRAHGGTLELVESIGGRTVFAVTIPDQPVRLDEARSGLRRPA